MKIMKIDRITDRSEKAIIITHYNARTTSILKMLMQARFSIFSIFHMTIVISDLYNEKNIVKVSNELQKLFTEEKKLTELTAG